MSLLSKSDVHPGLGARASLFVLATFEKHYSSLPGLMCAGNITKMLEKGGNPGLEWHLFGLFLDVCLVLRLFFEVWFFDSFFL